MDITPQVLDEFKQRMHITHGAEDENLKRLLSFSVLDLQEKIGMMDIEKDERAKELVFERTRYAYNDALEYFNDNYLSQILSLSISQLEGDTDEEV